MKVLIISQYYKPDITAAAFRISETVSGLKEKNIDVHVITSTPHKSQKVYNLDSLDDNITRIKIPYFKKQTKYKYVYQYFRFLVGSSIAALRLKKTFNYDLIFASSPPITIAFTAFIVKYFSRKPLVFDIRDIWPDSAAAIGKLKEKSLIYRFFKYVEKFIYKKADHITCVAKPMSEYIENINKKKNVHVIYNGVSNNLLKNNLNHSSSNQKNFVFTYAGNIGYAQNLSIVLIAFSKFLKSQNSPICIFQIVGNGPEKDNIISLIKELEISNNVLLIDEVPKSEIQAVLHKSDVLVIPLVSSKIFELTIPSKVFDYLSFGKPVLATIKGEGKKILKKNSANIVTKIDEESLAKAFVEIYENYDKYNNFAYKNIELAKDYSRDKSTELLVKIFKEVSYK